MYEAESGPFPKQLDSKQLHYQGSLENVARAPPETAKLYRSVCTYRVGQYANRDTDLREGWYSQYGTVGWYGSCSTALRVWSYCKLGY